MTAITYKETIAEAAKGTGLTPTEVISKIISANQLRVKMASDSLGGVNGHEKVTNSRDRAKLRKVRNAAYQDFIDIERDVIEGSK